MHRVARLLHHTSGPAESRRPLCDTCCGIYSGRHRLSFLIPPEFASALKFASSGAGESHGNTYRRQRYFAGKCTNDISTNDRGTNDGAASHRHARIDQSRRELSDLATEGVRTRFVGRRDRAPDWLQAKLADLEAATAGETRLTLWIAFDYGGRAELVEAARRIAESGVEPGDIDESLVARHLYAPDMPDPDLVIRTSGELRVSNFLLWQSAYAEFVFVDTLWPDFGPVEFRAAIEDYASRRRRFGGR